MFEIDEEKSICFTGNRTIVHTEKLIYAKVRNIILSEIDKGFDTFLCGMAIGFDLISGKACLDLIEEGKKIKLVCVLPHPSHGTNFYGKDKEIHTKLKQHASRVFITSTSYTPYCMHLRNRFLVDNSSKVIAYLNKGAGGTFYTVNYALNLNHEIIDARPCEVSF